MIDVWTPEGHRPTPRWKPVWASLTRERSDEVLDAFFAEDERYHQASSWSETHVYTILRMANGGPVVAEAERVTQGNRR